MEPRPEGTDSSGRACDHTGELIQRFVSSDLKTADERAMRLHIEGCPECRDRYRAAVMTTARIGHERRIQRLAGERENRHKKLRDLAFAAPSHVPSRLYRLRTLLYPAFFCFLMVQIAHVPGRAPRLMLAWVSGEVLAGNQRLVNRDATTRLVPGDWCLTQEDSEAKIQLRDTRLTVRPHSRLLIERTWPLRLRLVRGELELEGGCVVTTEMGVIDLSEGEARVHYAAERLTVASISGKLSFTGPRGARDLAAGESLHAEP